MQRDWTRPAARVAIVGLGAGTLASYARPGQSWTFYEIDPVVERIARDPRFFTYLTRLSRPKPSRSFWAMPGMRLLEARRSRLSAHRARRLQLRLRLPVHLLSREAIRLYRAQAGPGRLTGYSTCRTATSTSTR